MTGKKRKLGHIFLGIGITVLCLWLAVPGSDLTSKIEGLKVTVGILKNAEYWWLAPLLFLLALFFLTKAYRWALLLHPIRRFRTLQVFPATMIGFMGNNVLPAHLGELVRMYVLSKTYALSKTSVLSSIVLERLLDAVALTILFTLCALTLELPGAFKMVGVLFAVGVAFVLGCMMLYVYRTRTVQQLWRRYFHFLPEKFFKKVDDMIIAGSHGLDTLRKPRLFAYLVLFSIFHWALLSIYIDFVFRAFSIDISFTAALLVLCCSVLGVMIPSAPGYWGVIQAVFVLALKPLGVSQEMALAASVYYLASQYFPTTLTGLIFMGSAGFRVGELAAQAETDAGPDALNAQVVGLQDE